MKRLALALLLSLSPAAFSANCGEPAPEVEFLFTLRDPNSLIYVNGVLTHGVGPKRRLYSRGLVTCHIYGYEIAVESRYLNRVFNVDAQGGESYRFDY